MSKIETKLAPRNLNVRYDKFVGIKVTNLKLADVVWESAKVSQSIFLLLQDTNLVQKKNNLRLALAASLLTVNAILAASKSFCQIQAPPEEIDIVTDDSGDLILRCRHNDPHRWRLNGTRL